MTALTIATALDYAERTTKSFSGNPHPLAYAVFLRPSKGQAIFYGGSREPNTTPTGNKFRRLNAVVEARHPTKVAHTKLNVQETVMSNSIAPFALSTIRNDNGLFSLNDLHLAAGGQEKHKPAFFLRNEQTKDLIAEIDNQNNQVAKMHLAIKVIHGGNHRGTYACKQIVCAYAMWISPAFYLSVINHFLNSQAPVAYLTDEQLAHIKYGVRLKVLSSGKSWQAVYRELFEHVQAPSVREIKAERFEAACAFLGISTTLRGITEKDLKSVDALPAPIEQKPSHIASIDFDLRYNADYSVFIRDGKARRREVIHAEKDYDDRKQAWCMDNPINKLNA